MRPVLQKRENSGAYVILIENLRQQDSQWYFDYMRMMPNQFQYIFQLVKDKISKKDTRWRRSIGGEERLALTLRYLATGDSKRSLSFQYFIGRSTVTKIIAETVKAI